MSHPWLKLFPPMAIAACIGFAVNQYPDVNARIWQMVQARRELVKQGNYAVRGAEPGAVTVRQKGASLPQPPQTAVGEDSSVPREPRGSATGSEWETMSPAPALADNRAVLGQDRLNGSDPEHGKAPQFQVTLAVPPKMAIWAGPGGTEVQPETRAEKPAEETADRARQDNQANSQNRVSGLQSEDSESSQGEGPISRVANSGDELPPLVPIERSAFRNRAASSSPAPAETFESLPVQATVARKIDQDPQRGLSSIPLVPVLRNKWFPLEKPRRLPPVDVSSESTRNPTASPSDWLPSVPLYPSTGR